MSEHASVNASVPFALVRPSAARGRGVRVGVIDSGWDRTVDEPRVEPGVGLVASDSNWTLAYTDDDHDRTGHGTAASDLFLQVAPEATVVPIRVFGANRETSTAVLVAAIRWAVAQRLRLINISVGTVRPDARRLLLTSCDAARQAGTVVVAAAANGDMRWCFPAVFDAVVGAVHTDVPDAHDMAYRPNHALECGARGIGQQARTLGGVVRSVSGNSYAAPIVTGHLARLLAEDVPADVTALRAVLQERTQLRGA